MNIGALIRGLLGDSKPGEAKTLELKEGQVVRGVVLSVSESGKEAVVQIQGTPVRAELETPLQQGQTLNLQVGAPGDQGLPVLKPAGSAVAPQTMGEALETLGLKGSGAGREIVQAMRSGGLPLTKETAAMLNSVMGAKPADVPVQEWLEAAVISVKRGLPVTAESVRGLQQAIFGPQLHQLLSALEEQVKVWLDQQGSGGGSLAGGSNEGQAGSVADNAVSGSFARPGGAGAWASPGRDTAFPGTESSAAGEAKGQGANGAQAGDGAGAASERAAAPLTGREGANGLTARHGDAENASPAAEGGNVASGSGAASSGSGAGDKSGVGLPGGGTGGDLDTSAGTNARMTAGHEAVSAQAPDGGRALDGAPTAGGSPAPGEAENAGVRDAARMPGEGPPVDGGLTAADRQAGGAADVGVSKGESVSSGRALAGGEATPRSGEAAAGGGAPGDASARAAALLTKLQGVLGELRAALPQLAALPPSDAAGDPARADAARGQDPAAAAGPQPVAATPGEAWVARVLKLLGAEHEQQALRGGGAQAAAEADPAPQPGAPGAVAGERAGDTVKGVLLQAMNSSEVPAALKEAAGQLVQHLTGQQLLLNTDRTAPFAQVTLFLPLKGPDGTETASVHIQSRRGQKGELDASNCRLWFDLEMKTLGQTLVDVQVVDRLVSLKLHNNEPWAQELFESSKEEIKSAMEAIGYQLSAFKAEPLPGRDADKTGKSQGSQADYAPDSYKGVDYRI